MLSIVLVGEGVAFPGKLNIFPYRCEGDPNDYCGIFSRACRSARAIQTSSFRNLPTRPV